MTDAATTPIMAALKEHGITDEQVLAAFRAVDRKAFLPPEQYPNAGLDAALPIGEGQTISQPSLVAMMIQSAEAGPRSKVLEIGTGSGYQTALLAEIVDHVYTVERIPGLAARARETLTHLRYDNISYRVGDGWEGWPEHAPYDAIIVTAAPEQVPQQLVGQLAEGGRLIVPVGRAEHAQELMRLRKEPGGELRQEELLPVRFVPMVKG